MKFPLKLLLILCAVIAGIYATFPLWLPQVFATRLPSGWQLETLETSYPGFSGISINSVRVTGSVQAAGLALTAADIRFSYRGLKTEVTSLLVDVDMQATKDNTEAALTLDDLSLPITRLTGKLPELSINELRVALHHRANDGPEHTATIQPLVLNFQTFKLVPGSDGDFRTSAQAGVEGFPGVNGQLKVDISKNTRKASLRFPAASDSPAWLNVSLEQSDIAQDTTTQIHIIFNTKPTDQDWLNEILTRLTGGRLSHLNGSLVAHMDFTGKELQSIKHLRIATDGLHAETGEGTLFMSGTFEAERTGERIKVSLPRFTELRFQDTKGKINELIGAAIPELQRTSHSPTSILANISANSSFDIQAGPPRSMAYQGDFNIDVSSEAFSANLQATKTQIDIKDLSSLGSTTAQGLVAIKWEESLPITYSSDELEVQTDKLLLATTGQLQISNQVINYSDTNNFELQLAGLRTKLQTGTAAKPGSLVLSAAHYTMQGPLDFDLSTSVPEVLSAFNFDGPITATKLLTSLSGDEQSPDTNIDISEVSIVTKLTSTGDTLISTGAGTFMNGRVTPAVTFAEKSDISWQDLDLLKLTGRLTTKTQGFATEFDDELWTGFNFDITYDLLNNADINGSGIVKFDAGPEVPIEFSGNYESEIWKVKLQPTTIKLTQLSDLLRIAHFEFPTSIDLTDGYIDLLGDVLIDDEITAKMTIKGHELAASMMESSAEKAGFSFNMNYGNSISANGPVSIETIALAGGVDVAQLKADLDLENIETFGLKNLYADVFDGQLTLSNLRYSENRIEDTAIELSQINLGRLLAFADIDGLAGSGILESQLPFGSDQIGIYIKNGTFNSNGPGRLAYTKEGVAGTNIGLQALENFEYTDLSGTVDYQSDGTYLINVRLEGKNPDLYGGHPIVFNLNIDGSLPELFEAMFITGSFEEAILNQVKSNQSE